MDRIQKLKEFLRQHPADPFLLHAMALEYIKVGDDEQARKLFEELLQVRPDYIGSYYHLAKLLERQADTEAAIACYQKGMEIATQIGDNHAFGELRSALEELTF